MPHSKIAPLLLLLACSACAQTPPPKPVRTKSSSRPSYKQTPAPLAILKEALESRSSSEQILALHAIHVSMSDEAYHLLDATSFKNEPEVELTKVQVLSSIRTEEASELLQVELRSDMMLIRLEALYALAERKHPSCYQHLEAEFTKIDPDFLYIFPELFAIEGSPASKRFLKALLRHTDPQVRLGAVQALYQRFPDELTDEIKYLRHDPYPAIQEVVLQASLNIGHDDLKAPIEQLAKSCPNGPLLVAIQHNDQKYIEEQARFDNLFAINSALSSTLLYEKMQSSDLQVSLNATVALLEKRDPRCLENARLLFFPDSRDLYFETIASPGKILTAYKVAPSASQIFKRVPGLYEKDLSIRWDWLTKALELPENDFLRIAELIFKTEQNELVPLLVRLLENLRSERAIALLKQESEHFGSPFIRAACNLSLFRLQVPGPYYERLLEWVQRFNAHDLLKPRQILPWNMKTEKERYNLSFEETSNLLVDSYDALAESHKQEAIQALQEAIVSGNPHNKPLLAGLLLKADS